MFNVSQMTINQKHCLKFIVDLYGFFLRIHMIMTNNTITNLQKMDDTNKLSTPPKYDVDNLVQSDMIKRMSDANVEILLKTQSNTNYNTIIKNSNKKLINYIFVYSTIIYDYLQLYKNQIKYNLCRNLLSKHNLFYYNHSINGIYYTNVNYSSLNMLFLLKIINFGFLNSIFITVGQCFEYVIRPPFQIKHESISDFFWG